MFRPMVRRLFAVTLAAPALLVITAVSASAAEHQAPDSGTYYHASGTTAGPWGSGNQNVTGASGSWGGDWFAFYQADSASAGALGANVSSVTAAAAGSDDNGWQGGGNRWHGSPARGHGQNSQHQNGHKARGHKASVAKSAEDGRLASNDHRRSAVMQPATVTSAAVQSAAKPMATQSKAMTPSHSASGTYYHKSGAAAGAAGSVVGSVTAATSQHSDSGNGHHGSNGHSSDCDHHAKNDHNTGEHTQWGTKGHHDGNHGDGDHGSTTYYHQTGASAGAYGSNVGSVTSWTHSNSGWGDNDDSAYYNAFGAGSGANGSWVDSTTSAAVGA
jgi:hypothetical protein